MDFLKLCRERCSVRAYADRPVPDELLNQVLEAGRTAPTAMNRQPERVYVIRSREGLDTLRPLHDGYGAPVVLMICGDTEEACKNCAVPNTAGMDATIAATQMMLEAASLGLGTVWVCGFDAAAAAKAFRLPAGIVPYLLLPIGYPAEGSTPSPRHTGRKPLDQTVTYL